MFQNTFRQFTLLQLLWFTALAAVACWWWIPTQGDVTSYSQVKILAQMRNRQMLASKRGESKENRLVEWVRPARYEGSPAKNVTGQIHRYLTPAEMLATAQEVRFWPDATPSERYDVVVLNESWWQQMGPWDIAELDDTAEGSLANGNFQEYESSGCGASYSLRATQPRLRGNLVMLCRNDIRSGILAIPKSSWLIVVSKIQVECLDLAVAASLLTLAFVGWRLMRHRVKSKLVL